MKAVFMCSWTSTFRATPKIVADTFLYFVPIRGPIYVPAAAQPGGSGLLSGAGTVEGFRGTYKLMEKEEEDNAKASKWAGSLHIQSNYHLPAGKTRAASAFQASIHRAIGVTGKIKIPYLVITVDQDTATPVGSAIQAAKRAAKGESVQFHGKHFDPFLGGKTEEECVDAQLKFLDKILV